MISTSRAICAAAITAGSVLLSSFTPAHAEGIEKGIAVLRWLDKSTARVATLEVPVNESARLESLELIVRACVERPPVEPPESAAFLDIAEVRPGEPTTEVFRGWMFASSPALSAMEHSIYDVWVLDCIDQGETSPFMNRDEAISTPE